MARDVKVREALRRMFSMYGFAVVRSEQLDDVRSYLRIQGVAHLLNFSRLTPKLYLVKVNDAPCKAECTASCRDTASGAVDKKCFATCLEECVVERVRVILNAL